MTINQTLKKIWTIVYYIISRLLRDGMTYRAASLAYATLLAIVPLSIIVVTILKLFPALQGAESKLQALILENFVAQSATTISNHVSEFLTHVHELSTMNIIFLVGLDILMFYNIQKAFNSIWRVTPKVNVSISFLIYFVVLLVSPIFFGVLLVLGSLLYKLTRLAHLLSPSGLDSFLYFLLPHLIIFITFSFFNWVLPSTKVKLRHAMLGGLITTLIFNFAKAGFSFYLTHTHTYRILYGALATLPLFLVWLYVSWLIILLGALVTNIIAVGISTPKEKLTHEYH